MTIDIRANVYCNLGRVISGNFSDTQIQGNGLIQTSGSVVLNGIYAPVVGDVVKFSYYRNGRISLLPRTLRVLSVFADPFRRQTTVELGCKFTYFNNRRPPVKNPTSEDESGLCPSPDVIVPISAEFVFNTCLDALGLTAQGSIPLTSKFNVEEFDLSAGYVTVMGQLLVSEGYYCYLNEEEEVIIKKIHETGSSTGPLIASDQIIDLSPIGVGDLPGDEVVVKYNSLVLKDPGDSDPVDTPVRDWEYDAIQNSGGFYSVTALAPLNYVADTLPTTSQTLETPPEISEFTPIVYTPTPKTFEEKAANNAATTGSAYGAGNTSSNVDCRTVTGGGTTTTTTGGGTTGGGGTSTTTNETTIEESNETTVASYTTIQYSYPDFTLKETTTRYDRWNRVATRTIRLSEPTGRVLPETLTERINYVILGGQIQAQGQQTTVYAIVTPDGYLDQAILALVPDSTTLTTSEEVHTYAANPPDSEDECELSEAALDSAEAFDSLISKVTIDTRNGLVVKKVEELYEKVATFVKVPGLTNSPDVADVVTKKIVNTYGRQANGLILFEQSIECAVGSNAAVESRANRAERINSASAKPDTETTENFVWVNGLTESETYIELTVPYGSDDYIELQGGQYTLVRGDGAAKALNYGRDQNKILLGNRSGVSIQISADIMPPTPFSPIFITAEGITGQYMINGTTYTFDTTGIIASTDAIFWGGSQ